MVASSATVAIGEGTTDTGTMSVSVVPPAGELVIITDSSDPWTPSGESYGLVATTPQPPATVSAAIRLPDGVDLEPGSDTVSTFITVRDERGTGAGWGVILTASDEASAWDPVLEENAPSTITRLSPVAESATGQDAVSAGGTVSSLRDPMVVLQAEPGSGAGVYVQTLTISWPESGDGPGLVAVQLPSAP